jgi:hypothetical protein
MARLGLMRVLAERQHWAEYEWFAATYAEEQPYVTGEQKHEMVAISLGLARALMRGGRAGEARRFVDEAGRLAESAMYVRPVLRREVDEVAAEVAAARTGVGGRQP